MNKHLFYTKSKYQYTNIFEIYFRDYIALTPEYNTENIHELINSFYIMN